MVRSFRGYTHPWSPNLRFGSPRLSVVLRMVSILGGSFPGGEPPVATFLHSRALPTCKSLCGFIQINPLASIVTSGIEGLQRLLLILSCVVHLLECSSGLHQLLHAGVDLHVHRSSGFSSRLMVLVQNFDPPSSQAVYVEFCSPQTVKFPPATVNRRIKEKRESFWGTGVVPKNLRAKSVDRLWTFDEF
ncbi:hypothetical protein FNV43_RR04312 [Rhamnella rubrinervis]|uniref:Uncharacterized protein n=1 Tax=Rhamnella rubrinervis TaxID=2594499 RepID=A0A8K0HJC1_9ROSA|nr:hypothetical protein FNV43_RR04312 [Rhamnella rubrinervis]